MKMPSGTTNFAVIAALVAALAMYQEPLKVVTLLIWAFLVIAVFAIAEKVFAALSSR